MEEFKQWCLFSFFNDIGGSLLSKFQIKATSGPNQTGTVLFDWTDLATSINLSSYTTPWSLTGSLWDLLSNGTNYISVRVYDNAGNYKTGLDVFYVKKDVLLPAIVDNQSGDDLWRNTNNGVYDVDFFDSGGSLLSKIQIKATTQPNFGGSVNIDWSDFIIAIDSTEYTNNFSFPAGIWNLLTSTKNYISFKAFDNAGNIKVSTDTFYVLKDTTSPTIPLLLSPPDNSNSSSSQITFSWQGSTDDVSGINYYELFISTDESFSVIYTSKTSVSTSTDAVIGGGRYFWKVRGYDKAGNYSLWSSTFSVFIDTVAPTINDQQAWR